MTGPQPMQNEMSEMSDEAYERLARDVGLGKSPEQAERERIAGMPVDRAPVATRPVADVAQAAAIRSGIQAVVRQEFSEVRTAISALQHDVRANAEILKLADIPLEQVADSHERATHSFETLRGENVETQARLQAVETRLETLNATLIQLLDEMAKMMLSKGKRGRRAN